VRGDGGILKNANGNRFMFDYIPDYFRKETAETEEEAAAGTATRPTAGGHLS